MELSLSLSLYRVFIINIAYLIDCLILIKGNTIIMTDYVSTSSSNVCQAFTLTDESDVTVQAQEAYSFDEDATAKQILKVK